MNPFPASFKTESLKRYVKYVPLIQMQLSPDLNGNAVPIGYISDRDITVGSQPYVRKLLSWDSVTQDIKGSLGSPNFTFSNVDRILEIAAQLYFFIHAQVTLYAYQPAVVANGGTVADAMRLVWTGYITKVEYDPKNFKITCKDGYYSLTQPVPRRRATFMCDNKFDDGLLCPYSGFEHTGAGSGTLVQISNMAGVTAEAASDFGPGLSGNEGYLGHPGYTSCPKTFEDCKLRGMWRFYGGLRYVSSWASGSIRGFFSRLLGTSGSYYSSYSASNQSIFNTGIASVYTTMGYTSVVDVFQWRPEKDYLAGEGLLSTGTIGTSVTGSNETPAIGDVFMNGLPPHAGQHPAPALVGVIRSSGRIGETLLWDAIGGDMQNTAAPGDPPLYFNNISGVFIRVKDLNAGIDNPQYNTGSSTSNFAQSEPSIQVDVIEGKNGWVYTTTTVRSLTPIGNPAHVFFDVALDALDLKYTTPAAHGAVLDIQETINCADYCSEAVNSIVDGSSVSRYVFSGELRDLRPAIDQLDAVLQDMYGFRYWRNGKLCPGVYAPGHFDANARPAFKEFVNIVDGSFQIELLEPEHNELQMTFGDSEFGYQKNVATVFSEKYQVLVGAGGRRNIQSKTVNMAGTPTVDQATRIGAKMLKEELGGSNQFEWQQARRITLKSGFFMDELELGDITYCAHSLVPGGGGWVRVVKKQNNSDWTITFTLVTYFDSVYDESGQSS